MEETETNEGERVYKQTESVPRAGQPSNRVTIMLSEAQIIKWRH